MNTLKTLGIDAEPTGFVGKIIEMDYVFDKDIIIHRYEITESKYPKRNNDKLMNLQIEIDNDKRLLRTTSVGLMKVIKRVDENNGFPILTRIIKNKSTRAFEFTDPADTK
jgi:hypothetical protein